MPAPVRPPRAATASFPSGWSTVRFSALIFLAASVAYQPALRGDFLWDDAGHVTRAELQSLAGLGRIWFEIGATQQYYPVLHSAFWFEHRLWGDAVLGYHLLNVGLHATAAVLFAMILRRLAVPNAWFAALLFTLHPICVESVAWISEQKNTLSTVFYLAAALAYLRFAETRHDLPPESNRPSSNPPTGSRRYSTIPLYLLATAFFCLALLTKTVTATLPAALLVLFWWQRRHLSFRRDVLPLLPWFALGATCGLFTAHLEKTLIGAQGADFALSLVERVLLAGRIFWFYLGKLIWPADLIFIYPRWHLNPDAFGQWLYPLAGLALLVGAAYVARRFPSGRGVLAALLLFAGTLFPVLGFFDVYPFLYSYVADHFQYLAALPIFALFAAACARPARRAPNSAKRFLAGVVVVALIALTRSQASTYRNAITLYETTLARNPDCWMAHNNLAISFAAAGRLPEAIPHLEAALALKPDFAPAENNLGDDLVRLGRVPEAIPHFERALRLQPNYSVAHRNLGMALAMTNRTGEAVAHFARAAQIEPTDAEAELDWAVALQQTGRAGEAIPHFERALELNSRSGDAHLAFAAALHSLGRNEEAQRHILEAQNLGVTAP